MNEKTIALADALNPWPHCKKCMDNKARTLDCRLCMTQRFCANCGAKIDLKEWNNKDIAVHKSQEEAFRHYVEIFIL